MTKSPFASFADIVSDILANKPKDPILNLLVLAYEFDEQQLVNLVCAKNLEDDFEFRQAQLKIVASMRPIVIYDARKTKEFQKLPQFLELHPYKAQGFSCHHSKAYLFITQQTVQLVLGSFNLTLTGLFRNREVFEHFKWGEKERNKIHLLGEWIAFLKENYSSRLVESSKSALFAITDELEKRYSTWQPTDIDDSSHLLTNGYAGHKGIQDLSERWKWWFPDNEPDSLLVISPFFDKSPTRGCIAADLLQAFPSIKSCHMITDEENIPCMVKGHFGGIENCELFAIPKELSQAEVNRIGKAAQIAEKSIKDQTFVRALHAKVLMLKKGNMALAYMGSANFSQKAWGGDNQEMGLVWLEKDADSLWQSSLSCLGADGKDRYQDLPVEAAVGKQKDDPEEATIENDFPEIIEQITLEPNDDESRVRFAFELGNRESVDIRHGIGDYEVTWAGKKLEISGTYSNWLDREDFQSRLLGARNLSFQLISNPEKKFWLPYQYAGRLVADRETYLHPTTWDWMAFYLNPDQGNSLEPGEYMPGESQAGTDLGQAEVYSVQREKNCVIAMQGYLNIFSKIENDFLSRVADIQLLAQDSRPQMLLSLLHDPLKVFYTLLCREARDAAKKSKTSEIAPEYVFKIGELAALLSQIFEKLAPESASPIWDLREAMRKTVVEWRGQDATRNEYINFITAVPHGA